MRQQTECRRAKYGPRLAGVKLGLIHQLRVLGVGRKLVREGALVCGLWL